MVNVVVGLSAVVEFCEARAESTVCNPYIPAHCVQRPGHLKLRLNNTCAPIQVKNPMNAIFALLNLLKMVI